MLARRTTLLAALLSATLAVPGRAESPGNVDENRVRALSERERIVASRRPIAKDTRVLTPNCPNAVPDDGVDDADKIQTCLDAGTDVILTAGVYDIEDKIRFRSDDLLLTSVNGKATLRARSNLALSILQVQGANYYEISELIIDGNRNNRSSSVLDAICNPPPPCQGCPPYAGEHGSNFHYQGTGFVIHHIDTINAACGSGMEGTGTDFQIYSIYSADNGAEKPSSGGSAYWADGITINRCTNGSLTDSVSKNNTDIGIVVMRGSDCVIRFNQVINDSRYAFAGIGLEGEIVSGSCGFCGSTTSDNEVSSGYNLLSFGMTIGRHTWLASLPSGGDVAEVRYNTISGAVTNIAIDGISSGTITNNSLSNAQGNRYYTSCQVGANLTYGHIGSTTVQSGTCRITHGDCSCQ